jgi:hypothetical protein
VPKPVLTVCSFWVHRPEEHPQAADYAAMLKILEASCRTLGIYHVVLTDFATAPMVPEGIRAIARHLPGPLMRACTEAQAAYLEAPADGDTALVGADCIMRKRPRMEFVPPADVYVTYRHAAANYPINTGFQYIPAASRSKAAPLYRRIADRCGVKWCDDQRAVRAELEPMPAGAGIYERAGLRVGFLPMRPYNVTPKSADDPARGAYMVHFRGKGRKGLFFDWARVNGYTDDRA